MLTDGRGVGSRPFLAVPDRVEPLQTSRLDSDRYSIREKAWFSLGVGLFKNPALQTFIDQRSHLGHTNDVDINRQALHMLQK